MRNLVLCYHALSRDWSAPLSARPDLFQRHLEILLKRGYRAATFSEVVNAPRGAGLFAITFDDAFRSVYALGWPIMQRLGVPGTLFVPTDFIDADCLLGWAGIDQWLDTPFREELTACSWSELRELAGAGWEIGSHTCTHPRLTLLEDAALSAQLTRSRAVCEERMSVPCTSLAYPYGDLDERVVAAARAAGYTTAGALPGAFDCHDPLQWPRIGVYHLDDERRFRLKLSITVERLRSYALWDLWRSAQRPR